MEKVIELEQLKANLQVLEELRTRLITSGQHHLVPDWVENDQVLEGMRTRVYELEIERLDENLRVLDAILKELRSTNRRLTAGRVEP